MNKWQREVQESLLKNEEAAIKQLERSYKAAMKDILDKGKALNESIKDIDRALEIAEKSGEDTTGLLSMRQAKIYQKQYQDTLKSQVGTILDKLHNAQYTTINDYLNKCYNEGFTGACYDISTQLGQPFVFPINQLNVTRATLLNSKIVEGYYNRLGVDFKKLKRVIPKELSRGFASNMSYADIARNIDNAGKSGLYNAKRIARTEGHRVQVQATSDAQEEATAHGADIVKIWDAALDGRTRESHRKIDGEIKEIKDKDGNETRFSNGLRYPGDPEGPAREVCNCRCALLSKPRWALDGKMTKRDGDTDNVLEFDTPKDYEDFKGKYWSRENQEFMKSVNGIDDLTLFMLAGKNSLVRLADSRDNLTEISKGHIIQLKHGFSCFPDGDPLKDFMQKIEPEEGYYDIGMHGHPTGVGFGSRTINMSPRTLAQLIRHRKDYNGENIRLLSCSTGKIEDDKLCFAEELANALNVNVKAPNDELIVYQNGGFRVGKRKKGKFVIFKPNERRRLK